jgi:hypothetical protein
MKVKVILLVGIILILVSIMFGFFYLIRAQKPVQPKKKEENAINTVSGIENTKKINNSEPAKVERVKQLPENNVVSSEPEVFHIKDNIFREDQAEAVCKAFDSELASLSQLEDAYKKGADWCSYGWSKDGLALYPTQPDTFKKLQQIPARKEECGVPGVNGGFFENKNLLFGVNCYGPKPVMKEGQVLRKDELLNPTDIEAERISATKDELELSPFSYSLWSLEQKNMTNASTNSYNNNQVVVQNNNDNNNNSNNNNSNNNNNNSNNKNSINNVNNVEQNA